MAYSAEQVLLNKPQIYGGPAKLHCYPVLQPLEVGNGRVNRPNFLFCVPSTCLLQQCKAPVGIPDVPYYMGAVIFQPPSSASWNKATLERKSCTGPVYLKTQTGRRIPPAAGVCGHFGPKTLRTQDISAPCVRCRNVSDFCVGAEVSIRHFSTSAEMSRTVRH